MIDLLKEIGDAATIGIIGHVRPDGDCVGSTLGLYSYLKNAKSDAMVKVFIEEPLGVFSFLNGYDKVDSTFRDDTEYDVFIALDSGDVERLGDGMELFKNAKKKICIDHHVSNTGYGDVYYIEPDASSTCEVLAKLFDKKYMDSKVAEALYTGIVHDTGVFQYSNTSKETFLVLADLIDYGFDSARIVDETFNQKSYVQNQILGRALLESIMFMDGKCIASCIDRREMDFYNVNSKDLDGIVNQLRVTKGVEVAIFMHELRTLEYKISMRSNGKVDVSKVAIYFGGGGHVKAAGCTMNGTFYDVLNNLSEQIAEQLDKYEEEASKEADK